MAEVLKLPHFPQHDRVAEVDIRGGRVHAQLDSQLPPRLSGLDQAVRQFSLGEDLDSATPQQRYLLCNGSSHKPLYSSKGKHK